MRTQLRILRCVALMFAAACAPLSASAALQLVTAASPAVTAPPNGNGDSWSPIVSPDGRFVLFASTADNLTSNGNASLNPAGMNVYLRDRLNGTTALVSVNLAGTGGNGNSFPTALSTNGQFALFESAASDLVPNDTNNANDVFLRDVVNGVTYLISVATNGACSDGASRGSTLSPDGRFVAFTSAASDLTEDDTNGIPNVFVRDMESGTTTLASVGAVSNGAASSSESPEITPDGRYVAFYSTATNLVPGVTTGSEIYVRDLQAGVTTWASTNARTISHIGANGFCCNHAISDNGQYVAFEICTNSSVPTNSVILYYNLSSGVTETVSTNAVNPNGANQDKRSLSMTPGGQSIAFVANTNGGSCVYLWNAAAGTNFSVSGTPSSGGNSFWPDVDPTGRYVVFLSTDMGYTANSGGIAAVVLRDTQAGTITLVNVGTNSLGLPVNPTAVPAMSANGGTVAFESPWANLDGRNFQSDVFALDVTNHASQLVSVRDPALASLTPNGPSSLWPGSLSANGRYMAFSTWANNVSPGDTNDCPNVFVHDLITGANVLVNTVGNGLPGNNLSTEPSISADGRYVAFTSAATNLISDDNNSCSDIFVRDVQAGTTTLVSVGTNGTVGNGNSYLPQISSDGRYVLFCSAAQNLASGSTASNNLYLRDLQLGHTYALTRNGFRSDGGSTSYAMTPDGNYISFFGVPGGTGATNLYVWQTSAAAIIYTNFSLSLTNVSISPDGHWLAYVAGTFLRAQDLAAGTNCLIATGSFGPRAGLKFSADDQFLTYGANSNVFLYDFESGSNLLVSTAYNSTNAADGIADSPTISADGSFVAYRSFSTDAVPTGTNGVPAILVFDRLNNSTLLASANFSGLSSAAQSLTPVFSPDGQMLVFQSWASDLTERDFNLGSDLFALDLFGLPGTVTNPPPNLTANISESAGTSVSGPGQVPVVSWPFDPTQSYSVQYTDNLTNSPWLPLSGTVTFIGNQAYLSDSAPSSTQRFYRIVQNN